MNTKLYPQVDVLDGREVMRPLEELINTDEPGMDLVYEWISEAINHVEVLPASS